MRRTDREVTECANIVAILEKCDTLRLGIDAPGAPYVVPVSFGLTEDQGTLSLYFHCAKEGRKVDLLAENPRISFEGDIFLGYQMTPRGGITARYRCVMGTGKCALVTEAAEVTKGLQAILDHCGFSDYDLAGCKSLPATALYRIEVETLTGKENLPL